MSRFDQSRKQWAAGLDAQAEAYYRSFWGVGPADVYDLEGMRDGEYQTDDGVEADHIVDYSGVDKIVDCSSEIIYIAQRFRPTSDEYDVDFSFRIENGIPGKDAEYDKFLNGYRGLGFFPGVYAFGIVNAAGDAFEEFHLLDMVIFLARIERGELIGQGPFRSSGGTKALYYPIEDLHDQDCIAASWEDGELVYDRREDHPPRWGHTQSGDATATE